MSFCHFGRVLELFSLRVLHDTLREGKKHRWSRDPGKRKMSEAYEETESSFCGFLKRKFRCSGGINTRRKNSSIDVVDKAALRYLNFRKRGSMCVPTWEPVIFDATFEVGLCCSLNRNPVPGSFSPLNNSSAIPTKLFQAFLWRSLRIRNDVIPKIVDVLEFIVEF